MNGKLFVDTYLKDYMEDVRIPKNKYYRSLINTLKQQDPLPPLIPQEDLIKESIKHAKEMGRTGKKGHRSANQKSFDQRMKKFRLKYKKVKENNQYGYPDALSIVIDLLIDDGKESLTHRKTLLHKNLKYIGVGIRAHKKYQINTSLLLGGELITPQ
ncbi:MAG: CAP domain-containing protein [Vicingaceae bacterium]|nr:CAP domain-containing protein [Vicingaceae bacterium]